MSILGNMAALSGLSFWARAKARKTARAVDVARVIEEQRSRFNPLRDFTPDRLVRAIDAWRVGTLCDLARILEELEQRDDMVLACSRKMKSAVARCRHSVQIVEGQEDNPEAVSHRKVLERFWASVRVTSAFARNERGGFRLLVKQMMDAVHAKYAVHEIVWEPHRDGTLSARFQFVPLWMFENHTGELRYLPNYGAYDGVPMEPGEWLVTTGDGVGVAAAVAAMSKRLSMNDWLLFSEKCGTPGLHAKTAAAEGDESWQSLVDALRNFGRDWSVVTDAETEIKTVSLAQGGTTPYPELVRFMNKAISVLYRGADLSTLSGEGGDANGASLQGAESDILEQDSCEMLSETLQEQVDRFVIEWHFGKGTTPLAYIQIEPNAKNDSKLDMEIDNHLMDAGVSLSKNEMLERYGRTEYKADDATDAPLKRETPGAGGFGGGGFGDDEGADGGGWGRYANAADGRGASAPAVGTAERIAAWRGMRADLSDALAACEDALRAKDGAGFVRALRRLPKTADGTRLARELTARMKDAMRLHNAAGGGFEEREHPRGEGGRFISKEGEGRVAKTYAYLRENGAYKLDRNGNHVYAKDAIDEKFTFGKKFGERKARPCAAWDANKAAVPFSGKRLFSEMTPDEIYERGEATGAGDDGKGGKSPRYRWTRGGRPVPADEALRLEEACAKRISGQLLNPKASGVRVRADYANGENQIAQFTGGTGRDKTLYDPQTETARQKAKFDQVEDVCAKYDRLFNGIADDCRAGREEAEVAYFLTRTKCRIGGKRGRGNDNFGALDLTADNIKVRGDVIRLSFDAKNAHWEQTVTDGQLAGILRRHIAKAEGGRVFGVREQKVNEYLTALGAEAGVKANADGKGFTAHNIRHAGATRLADRLVREIRIDPRKDEAGYLKRLERVVEECGRHICDSPKVAFEKYIAPQTLFQDAPWLLEKRWAVANEMGLLLPDAAFWYNSDMKTDGLHNEADDRSRRDDATGDDAPFISDERVDEGWTVTPIGHKPGEPIPADFDPYEDDDDDDDDPPFYTEEDYRNMPVLRRILQDLGGEDPLAGEEENGEGGGDADKE